MPTEERILVNKSRNGNVVAKPEAALSSSHAEVQHSHFAAGTIAAEDHDVGVQQCPPSAMAASTSTMFSSPARPKPNSSPSPATNSSSGVAAVAISLVVPQPTTIQTSPMVKKGHTKMNGICTSPKMKIPPKNSSECPKISRDPSIVSIKGSAQPSSKSKGTSWLPKHQLIIPNQGIRNTTAGAAVNTVAREENREKRKKWDKTYYNKKKMLQGHKLTTASLPEYHPEEDRRLKEADSTCININYQPLRPNVKANGTKSVPRKPIMSKEGHTKMNGTSIVTSPIVKKRHTKMNGMCMSPEKRIRVTHTIYAKHAAAAEYKNSLEDGSAKEKGVGFGAGAGVSSPVATTAASKSSALESPHADEDMPIMAAHKSKKQKKEVSRPKKQTENNQVSKKDSGMGASLSSSTTATAGVQQHHSQHRYPPPSSDVDGLSLLCSAVAHATGSNIQVKKEGENNDSEDEDDDDVLGALIYNSSRTAKARRASTLPSDDTTNTAMPALRRDGSHSSTGIEALVEACTGRAAAMADLNEKERAREEQMRIAEATKPKGILAGTPPDGDRSGPSKRQSVQRSSPLEELKLAQAKSYKMIQKLAQTESVAAKMIQKKTQAAETTQKKLLEDKKKFKRPYNRYNVFFIFERERLVMSHGWKTNHNDNQIPNPPKHIERGYDNIKFPPQPPRFEGVEMARDWYIPWRKKKRRPHRKTHGAVSFNGLAKEIAATWKTIDPVTLEWCTDMEKILKENRDNLLKQYNTEVPNFLLLKQYNTEVPKEKAIQVGQPLASEGGPTKPCQVGQQVALKFGKSKPSQVGQHLALKFGKSKPSQVGQHVALKFGKSKPSQVDHAVTTTPEERMENVTFANKKSSASKKREAPSDDIDGGSAKRRQYTNSGVCFVPGCSLYAQSGNVCAMHHVTSLTTDSNGSSNHNHAVMKGLSSSSSPSVGAKNGAMNLLSNAPQVYTYPPPSVMTQKTGLSPSGPGATTNLPPRGHIVRTYPPPAPPVMTQDNSTRAPQPSMNAAHQHQATPPEAQNMPTSSAGPPSLMARVAMISKAASELTKQMDMKILKLAKKYPAILEEKAMAEIHHDVLPKLMMVSNAAHVASTKNTQQDQKKTHSQGPKTQETTQYQAPRTKGPANPEGILCHPVGLLVGKQMSGGGASSTMHFVNHNNTAGSSLQAPSHSTQSVNVLPNSNNNNTRVIPPTRLSNVVSDYGVQSTQPNSNGSNHPSPVLCFGDLLFS